MGARASIQSPWRARRPVITLPNGHEISYSPPPGPPKVGVRETVTSRSRSNFCRKRDACRERPSLEVRIATRLTPSECPLLAQSRHAQCADECLLLGAKRTLTNRCLPISTHKVHGLARRPEWQFRRRVRLCSEWMPEEARDYPQRQKRVSAATGRPLIKLLVRPELGSFAATPPHLLIRRADCCAQGHLNFSSRVTSKIKGRRPKQTPFLL